MEKREVFPSEPSIIKKLDDLEKAGLIQRHFAYEFVTPSDQKAYVATHYFIALKEPAKNIQDLNAILEKLPAPNYPRDEAGIKAKYNEELGVIEISMLTYYFNEKLSELPEDLKKEALNFSPPGSDEVKHTVTIYIYPNTEIAQAIAQDYYNAHKDKTKGLTFFLRYFDSSRTIDSRVNSLTNKEREALDCLIPLSIWNPFSGVI